MNIRFLPKPEQVQNKDKEEYFKKSIMSDVVLQYKNSIKSENKDYLQIPQEELEMEDKEILRRCSKDKNMTFNKNNEYDAPIYIKTDLVDPDDDNFKNHLNNVDEEKIVDNIKNISICDKDKDEEKKVECTFSL